ncbi:MAG: antitoxin [Desulfomonile tiedjei]|nr:antitoxin [Desulfomonile tiedjei]
MQTKLTLRLDEDLIRRAKSFAKDKSKSVSQIVADYFASLENEPPTKQRKELTPIVRSLKGALRGADVEIEDYHRHLEERHL